MYFPFFFFRLMLIRLVYTKKMGDNNFLSMGIKYMGQPKKILMGNNCVVNRNVSFDCRGGNIILGNSVDIAQEVNIWTLEHNPHDDYHDIKGGDVIIEDHVWIASRVTVLPNVRIGKGAVIACNSVVTRDVAPMTIVGGIPAKFIGDRRSKLLYKLGDYKPWFT